MSEDQNPFLGEDVEEDQICWKDSSRMCGEDCVAYDEKALEDSRWKPCMLLNIQRAQAKSFANISSEFKRLNDRSDRNDYETKMAFEEFERFQNKRTEAGAYAQKVKEMDAPPPKVTI